MLLTRFLSPDGVAEILDFMPLGAGVEEGHDLIRQVRVVREEMTFECDCRPAFDYAQLERREVAVPEKGAERGQDHRVL